MTVLIHYNNRNKTVWEVSGVSVLRDIGGAIVCEGTLPDNPVFVKERGDELLPSNPGRARFRTSTDWVERVEVVL